MEANKNMLSDLESKIKKEATRVLGRISLFLVYYIGLIILGVLLFWGSALVTYWGVTTVIPSVNNLRILILVVLVLAGLWALTFTVGLYLVKPLFSFTKHNDIDRVEIKEEDAPELFAMIREVAQKTECKFPKHVYLNTNVNACVFYNTTFWSIFFPVRKNLEIGLGLFHSTNVEEVKAIIAHEFGHFSQKSMKVGSTVYVVNQVLYNLIYTEDSFERRIDKWCMSETTLWAIFGSLTRFMTNQIKRLTFYMYKFVQRGYLRLSRQMEFEADAIACQVVGSKPFISSMYKINFTDDRNGLYERFLHGLLGENKCVENYWDGYAVVEKIMAGYDKLEVKTDEELSEPLVAVQECPSKVNIKNVWASHPALEDRIKQAVLLNIPNDVHCSHSSWDLIPTPIKNKMSEHRLNVMKSNLTDNTTLGIIDSEGFGKWVSDEVENHFIPMALKPFFNREFVSFDLELEQVSEKESPFTEENAHILLEYQTALNDWNILYGIQNGQVEVEELRYNDEVYKRKDVPVLLKVHEEYLKGLHEKVVAVDRWIYSYIYRRSENFEDVRKAYEAIFYVRSCQDMFDQVTQSRNYLVDELNRPVRREEEEITQLSLEVDGTERVVRKCFSSLNLKLLSLVVKPEVIEDIVNYAAVSHNPSGRVDIDKVREMVEVFDAVVDMHRHLSSSAYSKIIGEVVRESVKKVNSEELENEPVNPIKEENIDKAKIEEALSKRNQKSSSKGKYTIFVIAAIIIGSIVGYFSKGNADEGFYSDELVIFMPPLGLECKKIKTDDGSDYFTLTNENANIVLASGYVADASHLNFELCWENWKDPDLKDYNQTVIDQRNLVMRRYNYQYKSVRYDNSDSDESLFWEFAILYNEDNTKACICSVWSVSGTANYMDELLSKIKFK